MATDTTLGTQRRRLAGRCVMAAALAVCVVLLSACTVPGRDDGTDHETRVLGKRVTVVVTTDGGRELVIRRSIPIEAGATSLSALRDVADVRMAPQGAVAQVNGLGGGRLGTFGPEQAAWFYRVDGLEANINPARFRLKPGMSVWWDLRRFDVVQDIPAAVGVFPEPLFSGWRDAARPLQIFYGRTFKKDAEYLRDSTFAALDPRVTSIFGNSGIGGIGGDQGVAKDGGPKVVKAVRSNRANLVIARWEEARQDPYIADIGFDPKAYGLTIWIEGVDVMRQGPEQEFAERLRDAEGVVWVSTIDGEPDSPIVFLITGVTDEGVRAAVRALHSGACQFYLACAVDRSGVVIR